MQRSDPISLAAFAVLASQRGLTIEDGMLERLYAGYCNLQSLLASLPRAPDPATDPALVFLGDATELRR
jgi:hypothetical protein